MLVLSQIKSIFEERKTTTIDQKIFHVICQQIATIDQYMQRSPRSLE